MKYDVRRCAVPGCARPGGEMAIIHLPENRTTKFQRYDGRKWHGGQLLGHEFQPLAPVEELPGVTYDD